MSARSVSVVLFDGFELLDVFGPVGLLSKVPDLTVRYVGPRVGPVRSSQGAQVVAELDYAGVFRPDVVLVPGGQGTRTLVHDDAFLTRLKDYAEAAELVTSVCTGSALLAAAGLLDGYRATSNKRAFGWASSFGDAVEWVPQARWVHDRDRWTSSGVAAGMDMTAALIGDLASPDLAREIAWQIELEIHEDAQWDPYAAPLGS